MNSILFLAQILQFYILVLGSTTYFNSTIALPGKKNQVAILDSPTLSMHSLVDILAGPRHSLTLLTTVGKTWSTHLPSVPRWTKHTIEVQQKNPESAREAIKNLGQMKKTKQQNNLLSFHSSTQTRFLIFSTAVDVVGNSASTDESSAVNCTEQHLSSELALLPKVSIDIIPKSLRRSSQSHYRYQP